MGMISCHLKLAYFHNSVSLFPGDSEYTGASRHPAAGIQI